MAALLPRKWQRVVVDKRNRFCKILALHDFHLSSSLIFSLIVYPTSSVYTTPKLENISRHRIPQTRALFTTTATAMSSSVEQNTGFVPSSQHANDIVVPYNRLIIAVDFGTTYSSVSWVPINANAPSDTTLPCRGDEAGWVP